MTNAGLIKFSDDLSIQEFDKGNYLVHQKIFDRRVVVNKFIVKILEKFNDDSYYTVDDITKVINSDMNVEISNDEVHTLIYEKLAPLGIVEVESIKVSKANPGDYVTIKMILFSSKMVSKVSWFFQFLFNQKTFYISMIIMLSFVISLVVMFSDFDMLVKSINPTSATITSLLVVFGMFFHELGHATACRKFGAKHGGIGFGFYMLSPVLFADVTDVWKLDYKQRIIVNLAGFYLQLILITFFGFVFIFTKSDFSILFIYYTLLAFMFNLNPLLRYDGYWVLSDSLKIYNLKPRSIKIFKETFISFFKSFKINLHSRLDYFLFFYGFLSIGFIIFFLSYFVIKNPNSILHFPKNFYLFFQELVTTEQDLDYDWIKVELKKLAAPMFFYFIVIKMVLKRTLRIKKIFKF